MARRSRPPDRPGVVGVIGAGSPLGAAVMQRLAQRTDLDGLCALDAPPDGGIHTLVQAELTPGAGVATLEAALYAGARRVVLCTSAQVYAGGGPDLLLDAAPLREVPDGAHLETERLAQAARLTGVEVTVLRPAPVVGLPSGDDGPLLRQLAAPRLLAVRGVESLWQVCHVDDLVSAVELAVTGAATGGLGVACEGALPQPAVERLLGKRRVELPAAVALATAERLHRLGGRGTSPRELDHLLGSVVLACDGLRAAGWVPTWTNERALQAHASRSVDTRAVAYTAAGATVALLGTAALVRQARRRRRI